MLTAKCMFVCVWLRVINAAQSTGNAPKRASISNGFFVCTKCLGMINRPLLIIVIVITMIYPTEREREREDYDVFDGNVDLTYSSRRASPFTYFRLRLRRVYWFCDDLFFFFCPFLFAGEDLFVGL